MSKWKCEICNTEFENFEARGFNHTIYCPLCYYKKLYKQQKEVLDKIKEVLEYWKKELYSGEAEAIIDDIEETLEEIK